jgi:hypothetical protein
MLRFLRKIFKCAPVVELADTLGLEPSALNKHGGSTPPEGTMIYLPYEAEKILSDNLWQLYNDDLVFEEKIDLDTWDNESPAVKKEE